MDQYLSQRMLHEEADVVIINLGGNDITPVSTPEEIFRRICGEFLTTFMIPVLNQSLWQKFCLTK